MPKEKKKGRRLLKNPWYCEVCNKTFPSVSGKSAHIHSATHIRLVANIPVVKRNFTLSRNVVVRMEPVAQARYIQ